MIPIIELGKIAYLAYGDSVGWKNYQGLPMPQWDQLSVAIQGGWIAAAVKIAKLPAKELSHLRGGLPTKEE